jgi:hypothetical protein
MLAAVTRLMMKRSLTMCAAREGSVGRGLIAFEMHEADIVGAVVKHERRAGRHRVSSRDDGRQFLVVDLDQFGRIGGLVIGLRHHEGDAVADPAHAILHQRRIARAIERRSVAALEPARDRQVTKAGGFPIRTG